MPEIIPDFKSRKGRPPLYDWEKWMDGKARKLFQGSLTEVRAGKKDFHAGLVSFRTMIHRKARDHGLNAYTHINKADKSVQVQFYSKGE